MIRKEFILSELNYRFPQVTHSIHHPEQAVSRPLFFENSGRRYSARIIVCRSDELNELEDINQPAPLFLCVGQPDQRVLQTLDLCILPEYENPLSLFNFIQRLFDRLDEWRQRLKETAETSADVTTLLDCAAEMLQNPLWLCDARRHVVAWAERYALEQKQIDLTCSYKLLDKIINDSSNQEGAIMRLPGLDSRELAVLPFLASGARFALVCAASERPFYGSDEVVFEHLSGYVKLMLSERKLTVRALRQKPENEQIESLLRSLLDSGDPEQDVIDTLFSLGWSGEEMYGVIAAEAINGDMRPERLHSLCDKMESAFPNCCVFFRAPVIVAVVRTEFADIASIRTVLSSLSTRDGIRFGVCEPATGLRDLKMRLLLAENVLTRIAATGGSYASFSDIAEEYLCERGISEFSAGLVCLRSILEMATYDREHETNYVETTDRYIKNRFNAVKTANDLFIHRSTFLYRLERIKVQFGLDLEAEMTAPLHLFLSLRLVKDNLLSCANDFYRKST
ncbi:MAG: helix-turn-helix domain-containing protein [Eubacteriales bacterium]|nr:helix-turn-helix domain-containing protein [Eubacteriales bacterium]